MKGRVTRLCDVRRIHGLLEKAQQKKSIFHLWVWVSCILYSAAYLKQLYTSGFLRRVRLIRCAGSPTATATTNNIAIDIVIFFVSVVDVVLVLALHCICKTKRAIHSPQPGHCLAI
jgi:hypothetical protein